jgi:lantibiotic modifying enzyme
MARLAGLTIAEDASRRADVERAVAVTRMHPLDDVDHLCCGNFGRLDLMWTASLKLDRPGLGELVLRRAAWLLSRAGASGGFRLAARPVAVSSAPSLFRGAAGIGYQLLRMAAPSDVPSLLLLD